MIFNMSGGRSGSSGKLNFELLAYSSKEALLAASPVENTIGVITDTPITSYIFSPSEPTGVEGVIWIHTGISSGVSFNALKENCLLVYPLYSKQYIDGAWANKEALSYIGGTWVDWYNGELYYYGNEYEDITGGMSVSPSTYATAEKKTDHIAMCGVSPGSVEHQCSSCYTTNMIDLTNYSSLKAVVYTEKYNDNTGGRVKLCYSSNFDWLKAASESGLALVNGEVSSELGNITITCDISEVSGSYYVGVYNQSNNTKLYALWLE